MYFRLTQTLHFNSSIILGMGLFLAEVYIWVMLLQLSADGLAAEARHCSAAG